MLDGLLAVVHGEVETEFINTAHTNVLLLRQLFQQAEKWHLKLNADVSELENRYIVNLTVLSLIQFSLWLGCRIFLTVCFRELLEKIAEFEEMEFAGARKKDLGFSGRLEPMNESGGSALLNMVTLISFPDHRSFHLSIEIKDDVGYL